MQTMTANSSGVLKFANGGSTLTTLPGRRYALQFNFSTLAAGTITPQKKEGSGLYPFPSTAGGDAADVVFNVATLGTVAGFEFVAQSTLLNVASAGFTENDTVQVSLVALEM